MPYNYPQTRTVDHTDDYHGTAVPDPYRWLEEMQAPEVLDWAVAQKDLAESVIRTDERWKTLRQRLNQLSKFNKATPPKRAAGKLFYFETDGVRSQPWLMMQDGEGGEPVVVLDINAMSKDGTVAVPVFEPSPDGKLIAYSVAEGGSDWNTVRVRNIETGEDLPDVLTRTRYTPIGWLQDSSAFYYGRYPERSGNDMQYSQVWLHKVGTQQAADTLIFETPDEPTLNYSPLLTDDQQYIVLHVWHDLTGNRLWVLPLGNSHHPPAPSQAGQEGAALFAPDAAIKLWDDPKDEISFGGNIGTRFYFTTNHDAPRGRVVYMDLDAPEVMNEIIPQSDAVIAADSGGATICANRLVVGSLKDVTSRINIYTLDGQHEREVQLPSLGTIYFYQFDTQDSKDFYIQFQSFAHPPTTYRVDVASGALTPFRPPVLDFDPSGIEVNQVFYTSKDGTRIPMFIVHKQGIQRDGTLPVYMTGYGGFGVPVIPAFGKQGAPWMAWLELGGVLAIPNLRGGGEYGEEWHKAGMLDKKQTVFDDLHAAAQWLVDNGYTQPSRLGIEGGSNGGLLTSAAITQRPELYGAAVVAVPLTDMLRYQHFTIGRLWVGEYGSADNAEQFPWLRAYSPLHNVTQGAKYPATLVTTGTHDDRVVPAHAYKFAAAMQAAQGGDAPVLLHVETRVGHGVGKPLAFILDSVADQYTFFAQQFGMEF